MEKIIIEAKSLDEALSLATERLSIPISKLNYNVTNKTRKLIIIEAWVKNENNNQKIQETLIVCPDCGKEISRKAKSCPHCGCPMENTVICPYCNNNSGKTYRQIQEVGCAIKCNYCGKDIIVTNQQQEINYQMTQIENKNIPKCPICQSTNLSKISAVKKATKVGLFGIFGAGDIGKTWKCNDCGSKF